MEDSPSFEKHRDWLEKLIDTPTPPITRASAHDHPLTHNESPTEHVLRGSKSFAARSFRSRASGNSLRVPPQKENRSTTDAENSRQSVGEDVIPRAPILGEIQPNNQVLRPGSWRLRPSPTPTLTKKAAEAIVKAHGSPQHVRVTAGGRIVPSEQSPLCHPRYGYSAIKANGGLVKFAPNHPMGQKQQWTAATQNGFVAQDMDGRLCQIVNGTILPLNEVDGALRLYIPAPNLNINGSRNSSFGPPAQSRLQNETQPQDTPQNKAPPNEPSSAAQANALELEYSKLEHELRELDKTEVLHGRTMGKAAKDALVSKRRELVVSMDNIRRAIKGLKSQPPPDAPTSPRAMQPSRQSASPPGRSRLPPFLQHRLNETAMAPMSSAFSGFLSALPGHGQNGHVGFQPAPTPDLQFVGQHFGAQPPGMYVPPPPFDGPVGHTFGPYTGRAANQPSLPNDNPASREDTRIPQTDGAWSFADRQKLASPRVSRAIDIKAPEPKQTTGLRSTLNPMSPAYKPGMGVFQNGEKVEPFASKSIKDRAPTPLSPLHQLRAPECVTVRNPNATDDTISPSKKVPHLHSSSVSSFQTADFFPRNTCEYSTRKDEYADKSEDKENINPQQPPTTPQDNDSSFTASDPVGLAQTPGFHGPIVPPGTPMSGQATGGSMPINIDISTMPNRQVDNLSPKGKRQNWNFAQKHPSQASSTSEKLLSTCQELSVTISPEKLDFTQAPVEWIEGYRAGLSRKTVGADQGADFMDGYCAGVLKSKPTTNGPSKGSPKRNTSRRPSPAALLSRTSSHQKLEHREPTPVRPPLESGLESMDTLKEAIFAPHNESAILTPAAEGPHINEASFNLGAWAKQNSGEKLTGFPFPERSTSAVNRQSNVTEGQTIEQTTKAAALMPSMQANYIPTPSNVSMKSTSLSTATNVGHRVSSMTSIDSNLYRQYPGHRVFSPHLEWRSASSVAQAAGMATGCFANPQVDGSSKSLRDHPSSTAASSMQQHRPTTMSDNPIMANHSRFREASLDGLSDPTISSPPMSPPMSPALGLKHNASPGKIKKNPSPNKTGSPAKAKFENIAEKVGIKVAKDGGSPNSPPGKRRWRNVWLGAGKTEGPRDEGAA